MKLIKFLPLIIFLIVSIFLYNKIKHQKELEPLSSALIQKKFPELAIKNLNNNKTINEFIKNRFVIINIFASWCAPCRVEAPIVEDLSKIIPVIGIVYKDKPNNTKKFLDDFGNPYDKIGIDNSGKIAIEWGVYGVPETFLINEEGKIIYRHAGPLLYNIFKSEVLPIIKSNK